MVATLVSARELRDAYLRADLLSTTGWLDPKRVHQHRCSKCHMPFLAAGRIMTRLCPDCIGDELGE